MSGAVSAWSIVTTGHDVGTTTLPFLRTRLELKQPIYGFSTVPFWAVLGHTALAARLPAVVFGVLSVALIVWLARVLGRDPPEALMAGALIAILPWAVHYGRVGWEPSSLLPFSLGGLGLLWIGLRDHRPKFTIAAAAVLAVGAYAYHPALLMHAVLAGVVVLINVRDIGRQELRALGIGAAIAIVILILYGLALRDPLFTSRTAEISVFEDGVTVDTLSKAWANYWAQWDPRYLFAGAAVNQRIDPGAVLFWWLIPVFVVGADELLHRRTRTGIFLLAWLVLGPLPAALTSDNTTPHFARGLLALPPIALISAIGTIRLLRLVGSLSRGRELRIAVAAGLGGLALIQGLLFYGDYFNTYPTRSLAWWGYGTPEAFHLVRERVPAGATLCISTSDVGGFTYTQQALYYLSDAPFTVVGGITDTRCREAGTYVLAKASRQLAWPVDTVATIADVKGQPLYLLSLVRSAS